MIDTRQDHRRWIFLRCVAFAFFILACDRGGARQPRSVGRAEDLVVVPHRLETARLQHLLDSVRQHYDLPAVGAAVFTKDSMLGLAVVGVRRIGDSTPATAGDLFPRGSDTKALTAGLLGLLVDQGKLRWDSRLDSIFPELEPPMRPEYRDMTVSELLTHRSGIVPNPTVS